MVHSIIDSDLYKFSMQSAVIKLFPSARVRYEFIDRGDTKYPDGFGEELRKRVQKMALLKLTPAEYNFIRVACPYIDLPYTDFLMGYQFDPSEVGIIQEGHKIKISIEGYWYRTILWEVPLMAIISELYFEMTGQKPIKSDAEIKEYNQKKGTFIKMNNLKHADFGTRRRYSYVIQSNMISDIKSYAGSNFVGTSNVHFAMIHDTKPIGTHAHEWFMFHGACYGYKMANLMSLDNWSAVYRGNLGIALSDTYTSDVFFNSFDTMHAKLFDGVRHDSGNAFEFTDKVINHYNKLNIDPKSKTIVYSDGLTVGKAKEIDEYVGGRIKTSFGIGTSLSNDVGVKPLNIVIKMTSCNPDGQQWINTIKLSDNPTKHTGNFDEVEMCKHILKII